MPKMINQPINREVWSHQFRERDPTKDANKHEMRFGLSQFGHGKYDDKGKRENQVSCRL